MKSYYFFETFGHQKLSKTVLTSNHPQSTNDVSNAHQRPSKLLKHDILMAKTDKSAKKIKKFIITANKRVLKKKNIFVSSNLTQIIYLNQLKSELDTRISLTEENFIINISKEFSK